MANNGKDAKHTRRIARRVHFVRNCENVKCTRLNGVKEVVTIHKTITFYEYFGYNCQNY